jgi:hypothetical protein
VSKILVSKQDLERIALQAIRSFPGGDDVTVVEVEYGIDKVIRTNWTLHVFTRKGGNLERLQEAISTTRKRLRHQYDLQTES